MVDGGLPAAGHAEARLDFVNGLSRDDFGARPPGISTRPARSPPAGRRECRPARLSYGRYWCVTQAETDARAASAGPGGWPGCWPRSTPTRTASSTTTARCSSRSPRSSPRSAPTSGSTRSRRSSSRATRPRPTTPAADRAELEEMIKPTGLLPEQDRLADQAGPGARRALRRPGARQAGRAGGRCPASAARPPT